MASGHSWKLVQGAAIPQSNQFSHMNISVDSWFILLHNRHMMNETENNMQVQIAIVGDLMENYGTHDWDGTGVCPRHWKCKGTTTLPIVCAVDPKDIGMVMIDVTQACEALSVNNEYEWVSYNSFAVYPSKLSRSEIIEFNYKEYGMIKSISRAEIDAFLARESEFYAIVFGDPFEPQVTIPEPLPYEEYDIM